jgi:hypothetical protein
MLLNERATFDVARNVRSGEATLGEVFSFLSGLYFRGKLAYVRRFSQSLGEVPGALVITAGHGLLPLDTKISVGMLRAFSEVDIRLDNPKYVDPFTRDLSRLSQLLGVDDEVILLGSVATGKYVDPLLQHLGKRLAFPREFAGRGDMSRGSLMLRASVSGEELAYQGLHPHGIHRRSKKDQVRKTNEDFER